MFVQIPRTSRAVLAGVALSLVGLPAFAEALSIHYQLRHENMTEAAMGGIVIAAPVPEGVSLQIGGETTSVPAVFEVQAELDPEQDGLEWSTLPAMRKVADADGTLREEPLPQEAVAAVRWVFSELLEPGASALNTYRVRVD
jgi:hypothetical protein